MNAFFDKWVVLFYYSGDDLGWQPLSSWSTRQRARKEKRWYDGRAQPINGKFTYKIVKKEDL